MGEDDFSWLYDIFGDGGNFGDAFTNWGGGAGGDGSDGSGDWWGDIFSNWGGGQGGDGTNGSGDSGSLGLPSWLAPVAGLIKPNQSESNASSGSGVNWGQLLGGVLGGGGGSGGGSMSSLLPILAMIGGGINQNVNTREATDAMLSANRDAQNLIQGQLDRNATRFTPWTGAGADAMAQLAAMPPSNLAGRYKPLGSGRGISLASLAGGR